MKSLSELLPHRRAAAGWREAFRFLWAFVLFIILAGFAALFAVLLVDQRQQDWRQAEIAARNLDATIRRDIVQAFSSADQALLSVREMIRTNADFRFDQQKRRALLGSSSNDAGLGEIYVLDSSGSLVLSSETSPRTRTDYANEAFFYTHERSRGDALFTAKMVTLSPLKQDVVVLSRRLMDRNGRFAGVAAFMLRLSRFSPLLHSLDLGEKGAVSLFATDGTLLLRAPDPENSVGRNFITSPMFWQLAAAREPFTAVSAVDGGERLFSASQVDTLPLIVSVGLSTEEIYVGWKKLAVTTCLAFALLAVCVVGLSIMLGRELRRRRSNELRYRTLSQVDGLTGLHNRRHFDAMLEEEFAAAWRRGEPISVIMIDVDRFKFFNDIYGHQAGDDCLRMIAQTIRTHMTRATDIAARYGGEEIAVILPNTDETSARFVAESIRAAIESRAIAHSRSHTGHVTASFGTATGQASAAFSPATPAELVAAADEALYGAKRSGRNRVVTHQPGGLPALAAANEAARAAGDDDVLRPAPEVNVSLDRVSHMAALAFGTTMAFITLGDATRQRLSGKAGIFADASGPDLSFYARILEEPDSFVVLDATLDIRFAGASLAGQPAIRFYAGVPLLDRETGASIGLICIADPVPRTVFDEDQRKLLSGFAALAVEQLDTESNPDDQPIDGQRAFG